MSEGWSVLASMPSGSCDDLLLDHYACKRHPMLTRGSMWQSWSGPVRPLLRSITRLNGRRLQSTSAPPRKSGSPEPPVQSQSIPDAPPLRPSRTDGTHDAVRTPVQTQRPQEGRRRANLDRGTLYTLFGGLALTPFITYFYYQHRKEHMRGVKQKMLKEAQERYNAAKAAGRA